MRSSRFRTGLLMCLALVVAGCSSKEPDKGNTGKDEDAVKELFTALQKAIKARDGGKIWELLDADSRADADREAERIQTAYTKAAAGARADLEKALELSAAELTALDGKTFLKSKVFFGKYDEVPDCKIEKVTVQGNKGTLNYVEDDGDKEKLDLVREDGKWKLVVPMPKASLP